MSSGVGEEETKHVKGIFLKGGVALHAEIVGLAQTQSGSQRMSVFPSAGWLTFREHVTDILSF